MITVPRKRILFRTGDILTVSGQAEAPDQDQDKET